MSFCLADGEYIGLLPINRTNSDTIRLNIGGKLYETSRVTLARLPNTRLADSDELQRHYREETDDYFYDRTCEIFPYILDYYRSGELHLPNAAVCATHVKRELDFWGIEEKSICDCCWLGYSSQWKNIRHIKTYKSERSRRFVDWSVTGNSMYLAQWRRIQQSAWQFLDDPQSSIYAKLYAILSMLIVMVSVLVFCIETLDGFRDANSYLEGGHASPSMNSRENEEKYHGYVIKMKKVELACNIFFVVELIARVTFCYWKQDFFRNPMNYIDMLAIAPFVFSYFLEANNAAAGILYMFRIIRVLRIFKLANHHRGFYVLALTLRESMREIWLLVIFLGMAILIFASMLYYVEESGERTFNSIPDGFWWAVITMTTVGYGDVVPVNGPAKVVASLAAIVGVLILAFPSPIIINNFLIFYKQVYYGRVS